MKHDLFTVVQQIEAWRDMGHDRMGYKGLSYIFGCDSSERKGIDEPRNSV